MAKTLHAYLQEIKDHINANDNEQAILMARKLLQYYPKCIKAYDLLGEALLNKGSSQPAAEVFRLVLEAEPADLIAHSGLAIIYEEQGNLDLAIAEMEMALALMPSNNEVREALADLYTRRQGGVPKRVKTTPVALAYMYLRGGQYLRAIDEFSILLSRQPEQPELLLGLAEALWREGRRGEAANLCQILLKSHPNCLRATLILAQIWFEDGVTEEADTLWKRALALDPENETAGALFNHTPFVIPPLIQPRSVELPEQF